MFATEGIILPSNVVQRGLDSYVLNTDVGSVRIDTPLHEMRIGTVHRGGGPRRHSDGQWDSFDGFLLDLVRRVKPFRNAMRPSVLFPMAGEAARALVSKSPTPEVGEAEDWSTRPDRRRPSA